MTIRLLPESEWPRLTETGIALPQALRSAAVDGTVFVVEDETGAILGTTILMTCLHGDIWIREDHRQKSAVGRILLRAMRHGVKQWNAQGLVACPVTPAGQRLTDDLHGVRLPGDQYVVALT